MVRPSVSQPRSREFKSWRDVIQWNGRRDENMWTKQILPLSLFAHVIVEQTLPKTSSSTWMEQNEQSAQACDQIWRNLTTLALCCKTLVILKRFIYNLAKLWTHFGIFFIVLGKWAVLQMAKFWTHKLTIWSHCSLVLFLSPHSHPVYCFAVANAHGPSH